jgi:hypothetical protein
VIILSYFCLLILGTGIHSIPNLIVIPSWLSLPKLVNRFLFAPDVMIILSWICLLQIGGLSNISISPHILITPPDQFKLNYKMPCLQQQMTFPPGIKCTCISPTATHSESRKKKCILKIC